MKTRFAVVLVSLVLLASGCAQKANNPADVQAITKTLEDYTKAINARNAGAAVAMMTDKTVFAETNLPALTGKEEVRKLFQGFFDQFKQLDMEFNSSVLEVQAEGNLGTARGVWTIKTTNTEGTLAPANDSGNYAVICRRQGDGSWKWDSAIIQSDQPLPGTTAERKDENELVQIERDMAQGAVRADAAAMSTDRGQVRTRAQVLGRLGNAYKLESLTLGEIKPRVFGDVAVVTIQGRMAGTYNGKDTSGTLHGVDFFVRRDGRWQCVYTQNTTTIP